MWLVLLATCTPSSLLPMAIECPSSMAPSPSAARRSRRYRLAFRSGARCVSYGAPGLSRCAAAAQPWSFDDHGGVPEAAACGLEVEEFGEEASASGGCLAGDEYFTKLLKSLDLDCALRFLEELPTHAMGTGTPRSDSASDWSGELANPLDVVYEAVAELSCHGKASESRGWVDVDVVTAAASKTLSCDMAAAAPIVREAIDNWCMLAVMDLNPRCSMVKFVVPFFLRDGSERQPVTQAGNAPCEPYSEPYCEPFSVKKLG